MPSPRRTPPPESFLPLTPAAFEILLALAGGELHGYAIMQAVERRTDGATKLLPGTLYRALSRMLEGGLIVDARSRRRPGEERRRRYLITELGRQTLAAETRRLSRQVRAAKRVESRAPEDRDSAKASES